MLVQREAKLGKDLASEQNKASIARKDYEQKSAQIKAQQAEASEMARITDDAKKEAEDGRRRLDEAEDLLRKSANGAGYL